MLGLVFRVLSIMWMLRALAGGPSRFISYILLRQAGRQLDKWLR